MYNLYLKRGIKTDYVLIKINYLIELQVESLVIWCMNLKHSRFNKNETSTSVIRVQKRQLTLWLLEI